MDALYELKDKLCKELEEYGKKDLSAGSLSTIDTLAHAVKNIDKILETYETEGSYRDGSYRGGSYRGGRSYRSMYDGSYRRRDGMGRYSRTEDMVERLRDMMNEAPDDRTRQEIQKLVTKMEQM